MENFDYETYRHELAKNLRKEPSREKRVEILEEARVTEKYKAAEKEHRVESRANIEIKKELAQEFETTDQKFESYRPTIEFLKKVGIYKAPDLYYFLVNYPSRNNFEKIEPSETNDFIKEKLPERLKIFSQEKIAPIIYLHYPYCSSICTGCDYYTEIFGKAVKEGKEKQYVENVVSQIKQFKSLTGAKFPEANISFGGGTPSLMKVEDVELWMKTCKAELEIENLKEVNLEIHPEIIEKLGEDGFRNYLRKLREIGFNRLSIGVQSTEEEILKKIARGHDVSSALATFRVIKKEEGWNTNIDVMWGGLPGERIETYARTLKATFSNLKPDTVTTYETRIRPGTPEYKRYLKNIESGKLHYPSPEEIVKERFLANAVAEKFGYTHSHSDWYKLRSRVEPVRYQEAKWVNPIKAGIGFGAGAYSWVFDNDKEGKPRGLMWWNPLTGFELNEYIKDSNYPIDRFLEYDVDKVSRFNFMMGFKHGPSGLLKNFKQRLSFCSENLQKEIEHRVESLKKLNLIAEDANGDIIFTELGDVYQDEISAALFSEKEELEKMVKQDNIDQANPEEMKHEWFPSPEMILKFQKVLDESRK